ncbi:MAG: tRNA pseudouridine(13) synthase TruD [Planctomycetota bacterium]
MTIKHCPDDFQVEEILKPEFLAQRSEQDAFALYRLRKQGLATPEAIGRIARQLGVKSGALAYGGLKDKHASTIQQITLKLEKKENAPDKASGPGWELERLGFVSRSLTASDIHRNRFRIVLRNLSVEQCSKMDEAVKFFSLAGQLRIVNYFGEQRFGSARHHQGFIAKYLIRGDFEGALKLAIATESRKDRMEQKVFKRALLKHWGQWREVLPKLRRCPERKAIERLVNSSKDFRAAFCALPYLLQQLSVYAYQSYLWNETARRLIEKTCAPREKMLEVNSAYGRLLFPAVDAIPPELIALKIPLLARKTQLTGVWAEATEETLKAEAIHLAELQIPGVRRPFFGEELRAFFFNTEEFQISALELDETAKNKTRRKRVIAFTLAPGCYATVLLRALGE